MKILIPFLALLSVGCSSSSQDDGMSAADTKLGNDVNAWAKESGGDWSKLSPEHQQELIKSAGSEATAKKVFEMKAHPPGPVSGGPPANPGKP